MFNPFSLNGKIVLITGASSGIGRQCAIDCSKMGAKVVLVARNVDRLNETLSQMDGDGHLVVGQDLTEFDVIPEMVRKIVEKIGPLDGALHCAGISETIPLKSVDAEKMESFFRSNVLGAVMLTKEVCKLGNVNNDGASIVFFASVMGVVGESCKSIYSMTKGALISATRSLAVEYSKKKIRVNCVSPGVIETPINANQNYMKDPILREMFESKHLLGFGHCSDISNACVYLLSDASSWVTGQNFIIDGGYTVR